MVIVCACRSKDGGRLRVW